MATMVAVGEGAPKISAIATSGLYLLLFAILPIGISGAVLGTVGGFALTIVNERAVGKKYLFAVAAGLGTLIGSTALLFLRAVGLDSSSVSGFDLTLAAFSGLVGILCALAVAMFQRWAGLVLRSEIAPGKRTSMA